MPNAQHPGLTPSHPADIMSAPGHPGPLLLHCMPDSTITIGMLGCGIVGSGTVKTLRDNAPAIAQKVGVNLRIKRICVRDLQKPRPDWVDRSLLTDDPSLVLDDP